MSASESLKFPLRELERSDRRLDIDHSHPRLAALLTSLRDDVRGEGEVSGSAKLHLELLDERLNIDGAVEANVPARCDRCTASFRLHLDRVIYQVLLREVPEPDEELELALGDLDASELLTEEVDVGALLAEELQLALPGKLLCAADCKGLCNRCGADLNYEECTCEPEVDDRWAALAALKDKLK